ncbi:MAG: M1 family aminopeptidase [Myxococcota bacterium]
MLITTLLYLGSSANAGDRLETVVQPTAQDIVLAIDPAKPTFDATTTITFEIAPGDKVADIPLHGEGLIVKKASLRRTASPTGTRNYSVKVTEEGADRLRLAPKRTLRRGTYALTLEYQGQLHEQSYGLYRFEHDGKPYVVSQLEADEARSAWPCFDEPSYKIPWTLTVQHPADVVAISNMPIVRTRPAGNQRVDFFATSEPMPSYAVALAVGPYVGTPVEGMRVPSKVWTVAGRENIAASAAKDLPAIVDYLENWFGDPYPYPKLDLIGVPKFAYGAMENPGAIVYVDSLFFDDTTATRRREHRLIEVSAHEVAHMWFGNLVTLDWWDDLWLNESFASWMGVLTLDGLRPDARQDVSRVGRLQGMLSYDGTAEARPVRTEVDPSAVFETTNFAAYNKGEALLDMTQQWLGDEAFQKSVRAYLAKYRWGNATFGDLMQSFQQTTGKDVGSVLSGYLDRSGAPQLRVTLNDGSASLEQARYAQLGVELPSQTWTLPIALRVGRADGTSDIVQTVLTNTTSTVDLGENVTWVHPAANGVGYWAWLLDEAAMSKLVDARPQLSAAERRSIWMSLALGLQSGELEAAEVLTASGTFADETDLSVQRTVINAADMTGILREIGDEDLLDRWFAWQRNHFRPWFDAVETPEEGETAEVGQLRQRLLGMLAEAGDKKLRRSLAKLGEQFLEDPTSVAFDQIDNALSVLTDNGDLALFEKMVALVDDVQDRSLKGKLLYHAATIASPEVHDRVFERLLDEKLPVPQRFSLTGGLRSQDDDALNDRLIDWTMKHYDLVASSLPPQARMNLARTGWGCDLERFERTVPFFNDPARKVQGTERILAETRASVERCIRVKETREPSLRAFLAPESAKRADERSKGG